MPLQIYLGSIPGTPLERRRLRERALDLHTSLHAARQPDPTYALLNFDAGEQPDAHPADLLLLRPNALIVGAFAAYHGPIDVLPGGRWTLRESGETIGDQQGRSPLQAVREQRDAVRARLVAQAARLAPGSGAQPYERIVGALINAPSIHPDSRISLDVDEHRQQLKILGLDELAGLASMVRTGVQLDEDGMRMIAAGVFGGRLWHDGAQFMFDLAPGRFRLRLLDPRDRQDPILPLVEGENIIGRRRQPHGHEHRLALSGDDLISSDHAWLICEEPERVVVRDASKNGTWIALPGRPEEHVQGSARVIVPGTLLRMGVTRMRLEHADGDGA